MSGVDVLVLSLGTTGGLRRADALLAAQLEAAGASVAVAGTRLGSAGRLRRAYPVNDLVEAAAARRALREAVERERPRAVIVSTVTAGLLAADPGVPFAVRFDSPGALNRRGLASRAVLPALERRLLGKARMLLPWSAGEALVALPADAAPAVVVPPPVEPSGPLGDPAREPVAVAYVPDPKAKGLDVVCAGWAAGAPEGARLEIYGIDPDRARSFLARRRVALPATAELCGSVAAADFRAALRRARVLVAGSRWEDFGLAPLEALADGALLATTPAGGPYPALAIARRLAPDLVAAEVDGAALGGAIGAAFALPDAEVAAYRSAAHAALAPYEHNSIVRTLRERVLPVLLPS